MCDNLVGNGEMEVSGYFFGLQRNTQGYIMMATKSEVEYETTK